MPELLIVIAIIAILAMIFMANLMHARAQASSAACEANERALATAIEEFATDNNGTYPTELRPDHAADVRRPGQSVCRPVKSRRSGRRYGVHIHSRCRHLCEQLRFV